jgi:hypothetical protein
MNSEASTPENASNASPDVFTPVSPPDVAPAEAPEATQNHPEDSIPALEPVAETAVLRVEAVEPPESAALLAEPTAPELLAPATEPVFLDKPLTAPTEPPDNPALALAFSPAPDAPFPSSLALSLICARETAQIRYALGAHEVGQNALIFDPKDPILLTSTIDIAARAFENGERGPLLVGTFEIKKPLWQELEPADPNDATPHKIGENGACDDGWRVSAGSVRGKLHAHRGLWREDAFRFSSASNEGALWQIVAVSDGAGSAPLSRIGARVACDAAISALERSLAPLPAFSTAQDELTARDLPVLRDALTQSAGAALDAIRDEAARRAKPLAEFAATLLVLVRREWNGAQLCAGLQIGDGAIALWDEAGLTLLGIADHGQHSSETRFLTTKGVEAEFAARVKFSIKPGLRAFALMTDGVSDDYFPEEKRLGQVFEAVLPVLQTESDGGAVLVSWLGYEKKGSSDDRTLVVGWKDAPVEPEREAQHGDSDRDSR